MYIIKIEAMENNLHLIESQSHRKSVWMDGYIEIPSKMVEEVTATDGYCDLIIEDDVLIGVTPTEKPPAPKPKTTLDERVSSLEESNAELTEALDLILSGVTE